jgi:hypothetical protein
MALTWLEQKDFTGGINATSDHALIGRDQLVDAEDVFVDAPGIIRRRGPFIKLQTSYPSGLGLDLPTAPSDPFQYASGHTAVIATGKHDYNKLSQGIFCITARPDESFKKVSLWYFPFDAAANSGKGAFEAPILVFGPITTQEEVKTGKIAPAITRVGDDSSAASNAKYNRSIISCPAFTVVVLVDTDSGLQSWSSSASTQTIERTNGSDTYYLRVTLLAYGTTADSGTGGGSGTYDSLTLPKELNSSQAVVAIPDEDDYHYLEPKISGREFSTCALVDGYTFLAGDPQYGQHFYWSAAEDSLTWVDDDGPFFEHLPDETASRVKGLISMNSSLIVFKERSIFSVKISNAGPTDWTASQRASIGTLDQRSIAQWREVAIFANSKGIYSFDGYDVKELSENVRRLWEPVLVKWNSGWFISGSVYADYYIITVLNESGTLQIALCLHIPSGAWTRLTGTRFTAATWGPDNKSLYAFHYPISSQSNRPALCDLGAMFNGCQGSDSIGTGPSMSFTMPRITNDDRFRTKVWRRVEVSYAASGTEGSIEVSYVKGTNSDSTQYTFTSLGTLPRSTDTKVRLRTGLRSRALGLKFKETGGSLTSATVTGVRIGIKPMRPSRSEGN